MKHRTTLRNLFHLVLSLVISASATVNFAYSDSAPTLVPLPIPMISVSTSFDGRIAVIHGGRALVAKVIRPENIIANSTTGVPVFSAATFSNGMDILPNDTSYNFTTEPIPANYIPVAGTASLSADPRFGAEPMRSDAQGNLVSNGAYETYFLLLTHVYSPNMRLETRTLRVTVENPKTEIAEIKSFQISPPQFMRISSGYFIPGIEPTSNWDGRFIIFHSFTTHFTNPGGIDNVAVLRECTEKVVPGKRLSEVANCFGTISNLGLYYTYNETPWNSSNWSIPKDLTKLYDDRNVPFNGSTLGAHIPLARSPLLEMNGARATAPYTGAYPWLTPDGTELFHTTLPGYRDALRAGAAVIGVNTGYRIRYVDGPLNPDRWNVNRLSNRLIVSSVGATRSMWPVFGRKGSTVLPYTPRESIITIIGASGRNYSEVAFDEFLDGGYVAFLPMNEGITRRPAPAPPAAHWSDIDPSFTQDVSGNGNNGFLNPNARFPFEARFGRALALDEQHLINDAVGLASSDVSEGKVGQAIRFSAGGAVTIPLSASLQTISREIGFEAFYKPLSTAGYSSDNRVVNIGGIATADVTGGTFRVTFSSGCTGSVLLPATNDWMHLAFDGSVDRGLLRIFLNGNVAKSVSCQITLPRIQGPIVLGPTNATPAGERYLLDEVGVLNRTLHGMEARSYALSPNSILGRGMTFPVAPALANASISHSDEAVVTKHAIDLGSRLFADPRLSKDGTISCKSCHMPERAFTDGRPVPVGVGGIRGRRNTPTLYNRFLGSYFGWIGLNNSLSDHVRFAMTETTEMASTISAFRSFVENDEEYRSLYTAAGYSTIDEASVLEPLTQYLRSLNTASSAFDRYQAGDSSALSTSAQRGLALFNGKARCANCHAGINFTDERFHSIGIFPNGGDVGRQIATARQSDAFSFKTPTLRNVAETAPYFHDGSIASLEEVVTLYNAGTLPTQKGDRDISPLNLTAAEVKEVVEFLRSLSSNQVLKSDPTFKLTHISTTVSNQRVQPGEGIFVTSQYRSDGGSLPADGRLRVFSSQAFRGSISPLYRENGVIVFSGWLQAPSGTGIENLQLAPMTLNGEVLGDSTPPYRIAVVDPAFRNSSCVIDALRAQYLRLHPNASDTAAKHAAEKMFSEMPPSRNIALRQWMPARIFDLIRGDVSDEVVRMAYKRFLYRADPQTRVDITFWGAYLRGDGDLTGLVQSFLPSVEVFFGTVLQAAATPNRLVLEVYSLRFYQALLGRPPTAAETQELIAQWPSEITFLLRTDTYNSVTARFGGVQWEGPFVAAASADNARMNNSKLIQKLHALLATPHSYAAVKNYLAEDLPYRGGATAARLGLNLQSSFGPEGAIVEHFYDADIDQCTQSVDSPFLETEHSPPTTQTPGPAVVPTVSPTLVLPTVNPTPAVVVIPTPAVVGIPTAVPTGRVVPPGTSITGWRCRVVNSRGKSSCELRIQFSKLWDVPKVATLRTLPTSKKVSGITLVAPLTKTGHALIRAANVRLSLSKSSIISVSSGASWKLTLTQVGGSRVPSLTVAPW